MNHKSKRLTSGEIATIIFTTRYDGEKMMEPVVVRESRWWPLPDGTEKQEVIFRDRGKHWRLIHLRQPTEAGGWYYTAALGCHSGWVKEVDYDG